MNSLQTINNNQDESLCRPTIDIGYYHVYGPKRIHFFSLHENVDGMCRHNTQIDWKWINLFYESCCPDFQNKLPITFFKFIFENHSKIDNLYVWSNNKMERKSSNKSWTNNQGDGQVFWNICEIIMDVFESIAMDIIKPISTNHISLEKNTLQFLSYISYPNNINWYYYLLIMM